MASRKSLELSGQIVSATSGAQRLSPLQTKHRQTLQQQISWQLVSQNNLRKQKARLAARARRSREASLIAEIAKELLITQEKIKKIDKATLIKLAIDYIKAFESLCKFPKLPSSTCRGRCNARDINSDCGHSDNSCYSIMNGSSVNEFRTKLITSSVFSPKTEDMDSHLLVISESSDGSLLFVLKPDTEIAEDEDLTHLAPSVSDVIISLNVEPIERPSSFPIRERGVEQLPTKRT